jgi:hypothetical protein
MDFLMVATLVVAAMTAGGCAGESIKRGMYGWAGTFITATVLAVMMVAITGAVRLV